MRALIIFLFPISVFVSLSFCLAPETPMHEVNVQGRYAMKVPDYMVDGFDLNDEASLQQQNIYKEVYALVIDESAQEYRDMYLAMEEYDTTKSTLVNYAGSQMASIREVMATITSESGPRTIKTGCGDAIVYDVFGTQKGLDDTMGFTVGFVQGRINLYMIMAWTFAKTHDLYKADFEAMIASFRELSGDLDPAYSGILDITGDLYSMRIAYGMTEDTSLNSDASLEYADYSQELYILVLDEVTTEVMDAFREDGDYDKGQTPLQNYARVQRSSFSGNMKLLKELSPLTSKEVNGLQTSSFHMSGYDHGIPEQLFYKVRLIEGKSHLYTVVTWTLLSKRAVNEPKMDRMLDSFRELD